MQVTLVNTGDKDFYRETGRMVGMNRRGIWSKLALHYLVMLRETLGNA